MKKRKLNIIDIIIVISILAIVFLIGYKTLIVDKQSGIGVKEAYKEIEYELMILGVRDMTAEAFTVGDKVYEEKKGTFMGTVKDIRIEPYITNELNNNGELIVAEKTGYYTVYLTVADASTVEKENGYYLSGTLELKINSDYNVFTKLIKTSARASKINVIK